MLEPQESQYSAGKSRLSFNWEAELDFAALIYAISM